MKNLNTFIIMTTLVTLVVATNSNAQCHSSGLAKLTASDATASAQFGYAVAIEGDLSVVGAWQASNPGNRSGAVYLYRLMESGWMEEAKLTHLDTVDEDQFGTSVAVSGATIVVGAPQPFGDCCGGIGNGAAYVFEHDGLLWQQVAKLSASDGAVSDNFGYDVDIDGNMIIVGAWQDDDFGDRTGSAYIFERSKGGWNNMNETAKLLASDATMLDEFGRAVAISGEVAVVAAAANDDGGSLSGSAYVFQMPPGGWINMTETGKFNASDPASFDFFGVSVDIEGEVIMVGAVDDDNGESSGSVYVFNRPITGWENATEDTKLTAIEAQANERFGYSVSISGNAAMFGALSAQSFTGAAYLFTFDGGSWIQQTRITAPDAQIGDELGRSVAINGENALLGAARNDDLPPNSGSAYIVAGISDCNGNDELDLCDIVDGFSVDKNNNGIPDECEQPVCPWDLDNNGSVGTSDLLELFAQWGTAGPADFDESGAVGTADLLILFANWGPCN